MEKLLEFCGITKTFGGVHALRGVSLDLIAGEVHALVGENGAGKSTLIKIITGAYERDGGTFRIRGHAIERHDPVQARKMGIAAIYQQPALLPELSVAENIAMRMEKAGPLHVIRWRQRHQRAGQLLARVGAGISPRMLVRDLSMSQQQLVEIAAALGCQATLLILDEPTASLGDREVHNLFEVIGQLKRDGVGMIYISHRLEELPRIADRITVLRDGAYVGTRAMSEVDRPELIRMMVGRPLDAVFLKTDVPRGPVVLETQSLGNRQSGVEAVNLKVHAGEIVGLVGLVGAGRTELARILFGLTPADSGSILLRGNRVIVDSPSRATSLGIAYVPEDRRRHGVILDMSVADNMTLAILGTLTRAGLLDLGRERSLTDAFVRKLAIKTPSVDTRAGHLSGGNQQKVALARWLAAGPCLIILDEPTQGVDVGGKAEIHKLIGDLASRGMAVLMISSELPEILGMSDTIAVMHAGQIVGVLDRSDATQEKVLELALGDSVAPKGEAGSAPV